VVLELLVDINTAVGWIDVHGHSQSAVKVGQGHWRLWQVI